MLDDKEMKYGNIIAKGNLVDCISMDEEFLKVINTIEANIKKLARECRQRNK